MASNLSEEIIFLYDKRIQKQVYKAFVKKCKVINLPVCEAFEANKVTHIVSAFENISDVANKLQVNTEHCGRYHFVKTQWLSECLKSGTIVQVKEEHKLSNDFIATSHTECKPSEADSVPDWSFMSLHSLKHSNHHLTEPLQVLEKEAEFKGEMNIEENYARALAFRRCIATLSALPAPVTKMTAIKHLPRIGNHCKRVIQELLEDGTCSEVETIRSSDFYKKQMLFTTVFGVGPKTAESWRVTHNITSLEDACQHPSIRNSQDQRLIYGLAYHQDLNQPVRRTEALAVRDHVYSILQDIRQGLSVELVGGFRRGKDSGHDIDLLITHPEEGQESGVLSQILSRLRSQNLIVYGRHDPRKDTPERLKEAPPGKALASAHDEFEKWYGIIQVNKDLSKGLISTDNDCCDHKKQDCNNTQETSVFSGKDECDVKLNTGESKQSGQKLNCDDNKQDNLWDDSIDDLEASPPRKKQKVTSYAKSFEQVYEEATSERGWVARRVDLVIAPASQYYYALVGWTGSKFFNRDLRLYATKVLNMRLSSHALWDIGKRKFLEASSEQEVFQNMGLEYREPWERNA